MYSSKMASLPNPIYRQRQRITVGRIVGLCFNLLLLADFFGLLYVGVNQTSGKVLALSVVILNVALIVKSIRHKQLWLAIVFFFMLSYHYEAVRYFCLHERILPIWGLCQTPQAIYTTALCTFLFLLALNIVLKYRVNINPRRISPTCYKAPFILWLSCIIISLYFITTGLTGDNIFEAGGYGSGKARASSSYAYSVIFIIIALIYSYTPQRKNIVWFVCALFCLKVLAFGGRGNLITLVLALYMIYFRHKLSFKTTLVIVVCGYLFLTFWEIFRTNVSGNALTIGQHAIENASISNGNSCNVYYAGVRVVYMVQHDILTVGNRMMSLIYFLVSVVVPYSMLPPLANLSSYNAMTLHTAGGGLISAFLYAWGGFVLIAAIGWIIGKWWTIIIKNTCGKYLRIFLYFTVATTPSWFAYYPITLIKFCTYGAIVFWGFEVLRTGKLTSHKQI